MTGLNATASLTGTTYTVDATWNPADRATAYVVRLKSASGTVLDEGRVTVTSFSGTTTLEVGNQINVTVIPFNGKRRGRSTTQTLVLPDLTAPVASYVVTPQNSSDGGVTIQQNALSDNVSTAANITQSINWDDGTDPTVPVDGTVMSFPHDYGSTQAVYHPVVTVADEEGNERSYQLAAVVKDTIAPTGTFSASAPPSVWAKWTDVTVTEDAIDDDLSADGDIARRVNWNDGGAPENWTAGTTITHRYPVAGTFTPTVTIADEAGNEAGPMTTSPIVVTADTVAPRLRFLLPQHQRKSVAKWTTLKGRATDGGTGVRNVRVKAIERRTSGWYAYQPASHTWRSAGTKTAAWTKARPAKVHPTVSHTWAVPLSNLKVGLLVYKASGKDNVGNVSAWKVHEQLLTRP